VNRNEVAELGASWPEKHPKTGEPFVRGQATMESSTGVTQMAPPSPPHREVACEWAPDGRPIAYRTLSDEEHAAAMTAYRNACMAYGTTGGTAAIKGGAAKLEGRFETESGEWAMGDYVAGVWTWRKSS
jgi:hypothetical protein